MVANLLVVDAAVLALGRPQRAPLLDANRDGTVSDSEKYYYDEDGDGWLSDDERDEDADGLSNYDETHGRLTTEYWKSCYGGEKPYYDPLHRDGSRRP